MQPKIHVKQGDQVYVIAGKERGKSGKVLRAMPAARKVLVEGLNQIKKAVRPNPAKNIKGGIVEREAPLDASNVAVICPSCNSPTRIGHERLADGSRVRKCRKCGGMIDRE